MTSQQVWSFLPVAALLLLLSVHTSAEVVKSMSDCSQFFLDLTPPHVPGVLEDGKILNQNRYKPICQTYRNERRFATLYDTRNKIPVFSAFKFVGDNKPESTTSTAVVVPKGLWFVGDNKPESSRVDKKRRRPCWKIEPQLENEAAGKNMQQGDKNKKYAHQAGDIDYRSNERFDRGHIFPRFYASTDDDKKSTFTLTNIVPQAESFNKGSWNKMEQCVKCIMEKYCINSSGDIEGFVVTGAQPSSGSFLNNRVNIPSALWSAFCCYSANKEAWIASAHWGDNVPDKSEDEFLETITLEALYQKLSMSNSGFLFSGKNCPLQTTVTKFYPEMNKNCFCPQTSPESLSTPSGSFAPTPSGSFTPTPSGSFAPTPSGSFAPTPSGSFTPTPSGSFAPTPSGSFAPTPSGSFAPTPSGSFAPTPSGSFAPTASGSFAPTSSGSFTPPPPLWMCQEFHQFNKKKMFGPIVERSRVITQLQLRQLEVTRRARILDAVMDSDLNIISKTISRSSFCPQRIISRIKRLMSQQDLEELTDAFVFRGIVRCNIVLTCFPLKVDQTAAADPEHC